MAGSRLEAVEEAQVVTVGVEPILQFVPVDDQRVVGDLHALPSVGLLAEGQEPRVAVGEALQYVPHRLRGFTVRYQVVQRYPPPRVRTSFAQLHQLQE